MSTWSLESAPAGSCHGRRTRFVLGGLVDEGPRLNTGATSKFRVNPIRPPKPSKTAAVATARKEPAVVATTNRHLKLLGASEPQPSQLGNASAPQVVDGNDDGDDEHVDIDAFLNTGAREDIYMPPVDDEPPFRDHADQPARPTTVTQRLTFQGLSQETPPATGDEALDKPTTVFTPGTLRNTVRAGLPGQVKNQKHRKRKGGASSSQPPMIVRGREDLVPPFRMAWRTDFMKLVNRYCLRRCSAWHMDTCTFCINLSCI